VTEKERAKKVLDSFSRTLSMFEKKVNTNKQKYPRTIKQLAGLRNLLEDATKLLAQPKTSRAELKTYLEEIADLQSSTIQTFKEEELFKKGQANYQGCPTTQKLVHLLQKEGYPTLAAAVRSRRL